MFSAFGFGMFSVFGFGMFSFIQTILFWIVFELCPFMQTAIPHENRVDSFS